MSANDKQVGGEHYKHSLQPWDVIVEWEKQGKIGYLEGTAIKYIARHKSKGRKADLEKAIHFLEKALETYYPLPNTVSFSKQEMEAWELKQKLGMVNVAVDSAP